MQSILAAIGESEKYWVLLKIYLKIVLRQCLHMQGILTQDSNEGTAQNRLVIMQCIYKPERK